MKRQRLAVVGLLALVGAFAVAPPEPTTAAWIVPQRAEATLAAGTVMPPTSLTCSAVDLREVRFSWTLPDGGLPRSGYAWTLTPSNPGGPTGQGSSNNGSQASLDVSYGVLASGSADFSLVAVGPGGWKSAPVKAEVTVLLSLLGLPLGTDCKILGT